MAKAQSKITLAAIKKHIFWICVPLALLLSVGITVYSAGNVSKTFTNRKSELEQQKKAVDTLKTDTEHPNQKTIDEIVRLTNELKVYVKDAWTALQREQRERNDWPINLGARFRNNVRGKRPGTGIDWADRLTYREFIETSLPKMEESVRPRHVVFLDENDGSWKPLEPFGPNRKSLATDQSSLVGRGSSMPSAAPKGAMGGYAAPGSELEKPLETKVVGVLDWPQPEIYRMMENWSPTQPPGPKEIWLIQENLWVYRALLSVIVKVNANATGIHNAAVKRIEGLRIGNEASGMIRDMSARTISLGVALGDSSGSSLLDAASSMNEIGAGMLPDDVQAATIRQLRYVDADNVPLTYDAEAPYAQFNRMPVCLQLVVDQTKIPDILIECANCDMPMDILWVRFNPPDAKPFELSNYVNMTASTELGGGSGMGVRPSGGGGGMGGRPPGGGGGGMGVRPLGGGGGGSSPSSYAGSDTDAGGSTYVGGSLGPYGTESVAIEIYGIINIFNSPEFTTDLQLAETSNSGEAIPADPGGEPESPSPAVPEGESP
ncbi:MAG TPA: hypothetical protein DEB39_14105 [Planctomycetaceae bacterium]|nr:hypothetical protein [Planctomycetaceae bacterium]